MNDRFIQALSNLLVGKTVTILSLTGTGQVRSSEPRCWKGSAKTATRCRWTPTVASFRA